MDNLKTCSKCKQQLGRDLFNLRRSAKDGLQNWCKQCHRNCQNNYYKRDDHYKTRVKLAADKNRLAKRQQLSEILKSGCVNCGESDPIVLEFDHIDPATKFMEVGNMMQSGYAWNKVLEEISKCQILCANCHRRKTAKDNNWFKAR